jgi:hypothetical protein
MNLVWRSGDLGSNLETEAGKLLGTVDLDNGIQRYFAMDLTKPRENPSGCVLLGPFVYQEEAEQALEQSVKGVGSVS